VNWVGFRGRRLAIAAGTALLLLALIIVQMAFAIAREIIRTPPHGMC
jgi:hypothetical protein